MENLLYSPREGGVSEASPESAKGFNYDSERTVPFCGLQKKGTGTEAYLCSTKSPRRYIRLARPFDSQTDVAAISWLEQLHKTHRLILFTSFHSAFFLFSVQTAITSSDTFRAQLVEITER